MVAGRMVATPPAASTTATAASAPVSPAGLRAVKKWPTLAQALVQVTASAPAVSTMTWTAMKAVRPISLKRRNPSPDQKKMHVHAPAASGPLDGLQPGEGQPVDGGQGGGQQDGPQVIGTAAHPQREPERQRLADAEHAADEQEGEDRG